MTGSLSGNSNENNSKFPSSQFIGSLSNNSNNNNGTFSQNQAVGSLSNSSNSDTDSSSIQSQQQTPKSSNVYRGESSMIGGFDSGQSYGAKPKTNEPEPSSKKTTTQDRIKELENKRTILYHKRQPLGKYIAIIAVSGSVAYILLMSITMWFIFGKPGVFVSILFFSGAIAGFVAVALNNSKLKEAKSHNANISRQISDINKEIDDLKKKTN